MNQQEKETPNQTTPFSPFSAIKNIFNGNLPSRYPLNTSNILPSPLSTVPLFSPVSTDFLSQFSPNILGNITQTNNIPILENKIVDYSSQRPVPQLKLPEKFKKMKKEDEEENRNWKIQNMNEKYFKNDIKVNIIIKSRKEEVKDFVSDRLYSSLKYDIIQKIQGTFLSELKFLLSRIYVVDSVTHEEILSINKTSMIKGTVETGITLNESNIFEQSMKIQFTDVSYHHNKKNFCLKISYFLNSDLKTPVLSILSPSFSVFARKPNQKRKKEEKLNENKKVKTSESKDYQLFMTIFDSFIEYLQGEEDAKKIKQEFLSKLKNN